MALHSALALMLTYDICYFQQFPLMISAWLRLVRYSNNLLHKPGLNLVHSLADCPQSCDSRLSICRLQQRQFELQSGRKTSCHAALQTQGAEEAVSNTRVSALLRRRTSGLWRSWMSCRASFGHRAPGLSAPTSRWRCDTTGPCVGVSFLGDLVVFHFLSAVL